MRNKLSILCIIPARGGSKRLPRKNIKLLNGKPMIAYAIEAAKKTQLLEHIIVSTDDHEIAEVSKKYGAEVPFLRPMELASDTASTINVLVHAVNFFETENKTALKYVVLIQPTAPLLTAADIDGAIKKIIDQKTQSCVSMCEIIERPEWTYTLQDGIPTPYGEQHNISSRTQDLPELYRINGAVYVSSRELLMNKHKILNEESLSTIIMPRERSVDIDTLTDFIIAEALLKNQLHGSN